MRRQQASRVETRDLSADSPGPQIREAMRPEPLLTLPQVAEFLAVSERTVKRLAAKRSLHCVRIGRSVRFDPSDVRRWVETRKE
jgi:excisionase family DNA binding protein